ncbi:hypothetical protein RHS01_04029 [Rhizoctonia solani]|uniref:Uncharacterized protein n=1 Tax=Rhizoctonia solani TaxID=456999 RepID=A0A8H7IFP0_9AGAM|nr:hypothetical protein RHS01_04029 [Rhizoctonia solani]
MSKSTRRPPKLSPALFSAAVGAGAPTGGLPPSPSAQNPTEVHDAHVELTSPGALLKWKNEAGGVYGPKIKSVVLALPANAASKDVLGRLDALEELISKVVSDPDQQKGEADSVSQPKPNLKPIVLSNLLPPPGALAVPTVKLLTHPMYLAYQERIASLSFNLNVYLKYLPPDWHTPTPTSPLPGSKPSDPEGSIRDLDSEEKKEWKRRTKIWPAIEAFGYSRLVFGSSPSTTSTSTSNAGDWYQIAKESVAELGVDQEGLDAVFGTNAKTIYGQ